jgi:hypothetical protein
MMESLQRVTLWKGDWAAGPVILVLKKPCCDFVLVKLLPMLGCAATVYITQDHAFTSTNLQCSTELAQIISRMFKSCFSGKMGSFAPPQL